MEFDNSWRAVLNPGVANEYFHPPPAGAAAVPEFTAANAWLLAELSRLVYRNDGPDGAASRDRILAGVGLRERCFFDRRATQAALVEPRGEATPRVAALVFRGTDGLEDWRANLTLLPAKGPNGGAVHGGFKSALDDVWDDVDEALDGLEGPVFYTGHSLGGALAMLAAARRPPLAVYTFGAPRVGNARFSETLAGVPCYRVVNRRDRTPTQPPDVGLRYRHAGELRALSVGAPLPGRRRWFDPPGFLCDHAPVNYVARLERLARG